MPVLFLKEKIVDKGWEKRENDINKEKFLHKINS